MATKTEDFEQRLSDLDPGLFEPVPSQTSPNDRRSLLACQFVIRRMTDSYGYLEIGSYLGGSIQPHLLDPRCRQIYSIDKRPAENPDNRGLTAKYKNNSTQRMLQMLAEVDGDGIQKITCFDSDSGDVDPAQLEEPVQLCMVDGEHTGEAVVRDFEFCFEALDGRGIVIFHDAPVVYEGLIEIVRGLEETGHEFHAYNLPDSLMVFELGRVPIHEQPSIASRLLDNHVGYLASIESLDDLRRWANLPPLRMIRAARLRLKGVRYCE